ncbi:polysaccharide lyase family 8 super-sandwich domain-containing protein [Chitinophaga lutea]
MNKLLIMAAVALVIDVRASAQQRFVNFDAVVPDNWSTTSTNALTTSSTHVKGGANALIWQPAAGNYIEATGLGITATETGTTVTTGQAQIFIYSPQVMPDTLVFQFFDGAGAMMREGKLLLNFKGWREFHRSYAYDYGNGTNNALPGFALDKMRIVYRPQNAASTCTLYIDEATIVGDANTRIPGPQVWPYYSEFRKQVANGPYLNVLDLWHAGPDLPVTTATSTELSDLDTVRGRFPHTPDSTGYAAAVAYVNSLNIAVQSDGALGGKGIPTIYQSATLVTIATHVGALAGGVANSKPGAQAMLELFAQYLLSEGLAEGGRIVMQSNSYTPARTFAAGFLDAMPYLSAGVAAEVMDMLKWSNEFSITYSPTFLEGYSVDFLNIKVPFLFELALANPDNNTAVRDLKLVKRFLERNTAPSLGGRDGMKPDGAGYHHGSSHVSYMGAWTRWIEMAEKLQGTSYRVSLSAYDNICTGFKYLLATSSNGVLFAHAESGRNPFPAVLPVSLENFRKLVYIGGDIKSQPADPVMGAWYNSITGTNTFSVSPINTDGFYQFNYSALGVQRKRNWVAVMRGYTSKIFSAEIYTNENRYGRYQSYGTLEVLYGGTLDATGYIGFGKGWDWNVMPGTTTVHFPDFLGLQPTKKATAMEFQNNNFAGSLSLGQDGIFGLNLDERANGNYVASRLKAKKSVFVFDTIMVCLGSNIYAEGNLGNVATNLFQAANKTTNASIYVNSTSPVSTQPYDQTFDPQTADLWLLNAQGTGYYIPQGALNGTVRVVRGQQTTPKETVNDQSLPNSFETAYASKAWINHGTNPNKLKYHYVVAPGMTPAAMQSLATQLAGGTVYTILKQTDSVHIVQHHDSHLTGYAFFTNNPTVNTAHVKSVSGVCMAGIRENGDQLTVTVNSPDMNITTETAYNYYWKANPRTVSLVLNGLWDVEENLPGVAVTWQSATTTLAFTLQHGFSQTVVLKVPAAAKRAETLAQSGPDTKSSSIARFTIYPNPAGSNAGVLFTARTTGKANILVFNMQGGLVRQQQIMVTAGENRHAVDIAGLTPGSYALVLEGMGIREKGILIKQ